MKKPKRLFRVMTLVVATLAVVVAIAWMDSPTSVAQTVTVYKNPT